MAMGGQSHWLWASFQWAGCGGIHRGLHELGAAWEPETFFGISSFGISWRDPQAPEEDRKQVWTHLGPPQEMGLEMLDFWSGGTWWGVIGLPPGSQP